MIWFPYTPGVSEFGDRPHVPVSFRHHRSGAVCEPVPVLIDSGADSSAFPAGMAAQLGINLDGQPIETNRFGRFQRSPVPVRAVVAETDVVLRVRFLIDRPLFVLGRFDFFAHFKVTFDELAQRVGLEPYPKYKRGKHPHPSGAYGIQEPASPPAWLTGTAEAA